MTVPLSKRARVLLLAVAAAVLGGVWVTAPPHLPPLYDGVGFPDEPYRYVSPPAGYRTTPPPTKATATAAVSGGLNRDQIYVYSAEQGPQVALFIPDKGLRVPAGATDLLVTATPAAQTVPIADGNLEGNVYRVEARSSKGPAALTARGQSTATIQLRAIDAKQPGPAIAVLRDGAWQMLHTTRVGNDIYQAVMTQLGDYTLVRPKVVPGAKSSRSGSSSGLVLGIVAGAVVLLMVGAIVAVRLARSRGEVPPA